MEVTLVCAGGPARRTPGVIGNRFAYLDAPTPLAFAHRGGAAVGDENTVDAFARSVALGSRYTDTAAHASADGVAVVFHDSPLARIAGRPERVRALPWAVLAPLGIPRLDEVLAAWPEVRFNIDVKDDTGVDPTVEVVRRAGALDRVLLASFSDARTARMRALLGPDLATSPGSAGVARLWVASRGGRGAGRPAAPGAAAPVPVPHGPGPV